MTYAKNTSVPVERSRAEIERLLRKHGATQFSSGWDDKAAYVNFLCHGKYVIFLLPLPANDHKRFEQTVRELWRALVLVIKAKLEAVDTGITTFEQEFLAHIIMPGSEKTLGDVLIPMLEESYAKGTPLLLTERPQ